MKQKDIALFLVVGIFSAVISVFMSGLLITPKKDKIQKAEKVEAITASFDAPANNDKYFNKDAINPTKLIQIGDNSNNKPFNGTSNN
jgi:predicted RND superfamily exporter protein